MKTRRRKSQLYDRESQGSASVESRATADRIGRAAQCNRKRGAADGDAIDAGQSGSPNSVYVQALNEAAALSYAGRVNIGGFTDYSNGLFFGVTEC